MTLKQINKHSKIGLIVYSFLLCLSCSDYREFDGAGTDDLTDCEITALSVFETQLQESVTNATTGCARSGCHAQQQGSVRLSNDAPSNRIVLLNYSGGQTSTLTAKIHAPSHGGGDQSTNMPEANIDAWLTAEADCN